MHLQIAGLPSVGDADRMSMDDYQTLAHLLGLSQARAGVGRSNGRCWCGDRKFRNK